MRRKRTARGGFHLEVRVGAGAGAEAGVIRLKVRVGAIIHRARIVRIPLDHLLPIARILRTPPLQGHHTVRKVLVQI